MSDLGAEKLSNKKKIVGKKKKKTEASSQQTADSRRQTADSRQLDNDFIHYINIFTRNMRSLYRTVGHIALIPVFALGCTTIHWTALRYANIHDRAYILHSYMLALIIICLGNIGYKNSQDL